MYVKGGGRIQQGKGVGKDSSDVPLVGYVDRIGAKSSAKWGVQIVGMNFQKRSNLLNLPPPPLPPFPAGWLSERHTGCACGGRTYCEECGRLTFAAMRQTAGFAVCMHTFVAMEPKS